MSYEAKVKEFYTGFVRGEWKRLLSDPYHRIEYETTLRYLKKYLPRKGQVLDAGEGPGRYALELARRGYDVTLLDLAPANLRFATKMAGRMKFPGEIRFEQGSVVDLSRFPDRGYDAVLCLGGVLSHVMNREDKERAIAELIRVAKSGAPILVSVIGKIAALGIFLTEAQEHIELPIFQRYLKDGDYFGEYAFTVHHAFLPEELRRHFESRKGIMVIEMVGLEGLSSLHPHEIARLAKNKRRWRIWLDAHFETCTDPSVVGMSEHMMIVCKRTLT